MSIFAVVALLVPIVEPTEPPAPVEPKVETPKCDTAEYAALDFWVGDWEVRQTGKPDIVAYSKIERLYAGCAIRENWMPLKGGHGGSLSNYDPRTQSWHQVWIGSVPGRTLFTGGPIPGGAMVFSGTWPDLGGPGADVVVQMTLTPNEDGTVRQLGERTAKDVVLWKPIFDFTYTPAGAPDE